MEPSFYKLKRRSGLSNHEYEFLKGLEKAAENLIRQKSLAKGWNYIQQAIALRKTLFGEGSQKVISYVTRSANLMISSSYSLIEETNPKQLIPILKEVSLLTDTYCLIPQKLDIFNTLSITYRNRGKLKISHSYAEKALKIIDNHPDEDLNKAQVYLNLCTIMSHLQKHKQASQYCKVAIQCIQEELVSLKLSNSTKKYNQKVTVLSIAYHNAGVEEEQLGHYSQAIEWFKKSVKLLEEHNLNQQLLNEFKSSLEEALKHYKPNLRSSQSLLARSIRSKKFESDSESKEEIKRNNSIRRIRMGEMKTPRTSKGSYIQNLNSSLLDSGTDNDVKDLEKLGLLNYSRTSSKRRNLEKSREEAAALVIQRNFRKAKSPQPVQSFENAETPVGPKKELTQTAYTQEDLQKITKIQAVCRGSLARKNLFSNSRTIKKPRTSSESVQVTERESKYEPNLVKIQTWIRTLLAKNQLKTHQKYIVKSEYKEFNSELFRVIVSKYEERFCVKAKNIQTQKDYYLMLDSLEDYPKVSFSQKLGLCIKENQKIKFKSSVDSVEFELTLTKAESTVHIHAVNLETFEVFELKQKTSRELEDYTNNLELSVKENQLLIKAPKRPKRRTLSGKLKQANLLVFGEKVIQGNRCAVSIYKEENTLRVEVFPYSMDLIYQSSVFELTEVLRTLEEPHLKKLLANPQSLVRHVEVENETVVFKKTTPPLLHSVTKQLNNCFHYTLNFYSKKTDPSQEVFIEAIPQKNAPHITKHLNISRSELCQVCGIPEESFENHLDKVADMVFIEQGQELNIAKRKPKQDFPGININFTLNELEEVPIGLESQIDIPKPKLKFTFKKQPDENSSALLIQKNFRMMRFRKKYLEVASSKPKGKLVLKAPKEFQGKTKVVSIYQTTSGLLLEVFDPESFEIQKHQAQLTDPQEALDSLEYQNGKIVIRNEVEFSDSSLDSDSSNSSPDHSERPTLCRTKTFSNKTYTVKVFEEPYSYFIEVTNSSEHYSMRFTNEELQKKFGKNISAEFLFKNVEVNNYEVVLKSSRNSAPLAIAETGKLLIFKQAEEQERIICRSSKHLGDKLYNVVMHLKHKTTSDPLDDNSFLVFEVFSDSYNKKTISISLKEAAELSGLPKDFLLPIGNFIIKEALEIHPQKLSFKQNVPKVDLETHVTKIQAKVRGLIARKQVGLRERSGSSLVTAKKRIMAGKEYLIYAYVLPEEVKIEAASGKEQLVLHLENSYISKLSQKSSFKEVLEEVVIPKLYILEKNEVKKLCFESQNSKSPPKEPRVPKLNLENPGKNKKILTLDSLDRKETFKDLLPPQEPSNLEVSLSSEIESWKLFMRTGTNISGTHYVVSFFIEDTNLIIEAKSKSQGTKLTTTIPNIKEQQATHEKLDLFCSQILSKLYLKKSAAGNLTLGIISSQILYKKSHKISSRLFTVLVENKSKGAVLSAIESGSKKTLSLKLTHSPVKYSQEFQTQVEELISKLTIKPFLDGEMLILTN